MAVAGIDGDVEISTDGGTNWDPIDGIDQWEATESPEKIVTTKFAQTGINENSMRGVYAGQCTLSGSREYADANGQQALKAALRGGTEVKLRILGDGTNGDVYTVKCYQMGTRSNAAQGRVDTTFTCDFTAIPVDVP